MKNKSLIFRSLLHCKTNPPYFSPSFPPSFSAGIFNFSRSFSTVIFREHGQEATGGGGRKRKEEGGIERQEAGAWYEIPYNEQCDEKCDETCDEKCGENDVKCGENAEKMRGKCGENAVKNAVKMR